MQITEIISFSKRMRIMTDAIAIQQKLLRSLVALMSLYSNIKIINREEQCFHMDCIRDKWLNASSTNNSYC